MKIEHLPYEKVRNNAFKLAYKIYKEGFIPDIIYVSLRGGAYLGNAISEYFKLVRKPNERPIYYAAVVARSYTGLGNSGQIKVEGWTYSPEHLRLGDKVLLVDDIYDTGKTMNYLADIIINKGIPRADLKLAVHDYKEFHDSSDNLPIKPDYWCRKFDLSIHDEACWIQYLSHELDGLNNETLEKYYFSQDEELREALSFLKNR